VVSALTLVSRALGLVRDYYLVVLFGPTRWVLDAFLLAFTIPNLFRRLLGEGALAASFVPVFIRTHEIEGVEPASRLAGAILSLLALVTAGIAGAGMLLCLGFDQALTVQAPIRLTLQLTAVMLPFLCLVCCAALLSGMLQSLRLFSLPAAMGIILNVCFLASFAYVTRSRAEGDPVGGLLGTPGGTRQAIFCVAVSVLAAGVLQILVQWPALRSRGIRCEPSFSLEQPGVRAVLKALGPTALGLGVVQVNVLVDNLIAGTLAFGRSGGAVQYLYIGNRLMQLPLGVFGIAVATTAFPYLARHAARGEDKELLQRLQDAIRMLVFVVLPAAAGLGVLSDPLIRLIFQKPDLAFSDAAVYRTAAVLTCYAGGLIFFSLQHLLTRVFYAREEYGAPVRIAAWMVAVNFVLNLLFIHAPDLYLRWSGDVIPDLDRAGLITASFLAWPPLGEAGLALATTITAFVNVLVLWACLKRRLRPRIGEAKWDRSIRDLHWSVARMVLAATAMGVFVYFSRNSIPYEPELLGRLERGLVPVLLGIGGYWVACLVFPVPELEEFIGRWRRKKSA